jgi:hypothetical protein
MLDMKYGVSLFNFEVALPLPIFPFLLTCRMKYANPSLKVVVSMPF